LDWWAVLQNICAETLVMEGIIVNKKSNLISLDFDTAVGLLSLLDYAGLI